MSIERQAAFWLRNVNDFRDPSGDLSHLADGFQAFSALMREIFGDYRAFETSTAGSTLTKIGIMADDLENYHHLTETVDCLYHMAMTGVLQEAEGADCLVIDKARFKVCFKAQAAYPMDMLGRYGLGLRFFKGGKEAAGYKTCDTFHLYSDIHPRLIPAMKALAEGLPATVVKEDYAPQKCLFYTADFDSALHGAGTKQSDMDALRPGIVGTAGDKAGLWRMMMGALMEGQALTVRAAMNPYVFPNWTVKLLLKKKTLLTFTVSPDEIRAKLPLPYETARWVIVERDKLPLSIRESVERFDCQNCGKCELRSNIQVVDGVNLCSIDTTNFLNEDARSINILINGQEEAAAITDMARAIFAG